MASLFAISPPGFETIVASEIREMGFEDVAVHRGGVSFSGHPFRANVVLGCPTRILQRVGRFKAFTFAQLERGIKSIDWTPFGGLDPQVSCHGSRLYHSDAVRERIAQWLPQGPLMLQARIVRNRCIVSVDTSGALLHRRGWRLANGLAPMRENLAACVLRAADWKPGTALYDPMCGSGTLLIEAACRAAGRAPNAGRSFPCAQWSGVQDIVLSSPVPTQIWGSDRSDDAIKAATENCQRAAVDIPLSVRSAAMCTALSDTGLLVANPPYGRRAKGTGAYSELGQILNGAFRGWNAAIISTGPKALAALGRKPSRSIGFRNGGLNVSLELLPARCTGP